MLLVPMALWDLGLKLSWPRGAEQEQTGCFHVQPLGCLPQQVGRSLV